MKKAILIIVLILPTLVTYSQNTDGDNLFDDSFLHEIRFETADTNLFITTKDYQQLKMIIDGNIVDSVGFKRKGNISGYINPNKHGIKVKTNKYIKGKKYDGIKEFTLHINFQDPTMMREKLTYDICAEMGLFSLRTAFAKVYINNNYWGLYTIVEGKDEMYKQVFDNRDMDAIESIDFGTMCYISNNPADYDEANNGGDPTYKLENGNASTAWPRFATMIDKANNTPDNQYLDTVSTYLNLEDFFKYQAINVYLMNMDSYIAFRGNQIYVYDTVVNIWQITPWDFNASFGLWNTNNFIPLTYEMIPSAISTGCIASMLNSVPQLKTYYLNAMCELNNTIGDTTAYFSKIDNWKTQIQQAVYDDTRKHVTNDDFDNGIEYGFHILFGENQPALKTFIIERFAIVTQGLIDENYLCASTGIIESNDGNLPTDYSLTQNYPNPFNPTTTIMFAIPESANVKINVFNVLGENIATLVNNYLNAGYHEVQYDASNLTSGIYFYQISTEKYNSAKKMILLK